VCDVCDPLQLCTSVAAENAWDVASYSGEDECFQFGTGSGKQCGRIALADDIEQVMAAEREAYSIRLVQKVRDAKHQFRRKCFQYGRLSFQLWDILVAYSTSNMPQCRR
jgi:hypothetical protein